MRYEEARRQLAEDCRNLPKGFEWDWIKFHPSSLLKRPNEGCAIALAKRRWGWRWKRNLGFSRVEIRKLFFDRKISSRYRIAESIEATIIR